MTAANHTVTGAVIAAAIPNPLLALPAAVLSHFILDMLPHYGSKDQTSRNFLYVLAGDLAVTLSLLVSIAILQPDSYLLLVAAGALAASPDIIWLPYWIAEMKGETRQRGRLAKLLGDIQRFEKPWAMPIEAVWFLTFTAFLLLLTV